MSSSLEMQSFRCVVSSRASQLASRSPVVTWRDSHVAVGQGRGARVIRGQKGDTAMENERAISVGRSDAGDGVARKSADIDGEGGPGR